MISLPYHLFHSTAFQSSLVALTFAFYLCSPRLPTVKQRSWILTTISSAVMSIASLPLAYDYFSSYGDITRVQQSNMWTYCASRFFQAYLTAFVFTFSVHLPCDIVLGLLHYRSKVNWLTGWVHHSVYVLIVEYAIRMNWTHIFCLCAIMEIPTFVLAIATINPNLRSDVLFATTFFLTHSVSPSSCSAHAVTEGSMGPGIIMACILPLHAFWFSGCVKGFVRRSQQGNKKKRTVDGNGVAATRRALIPPPLPRHPAPSTLSRRRATLRLAVRKRWDQLRRSRAGRHIGEMQRRLRDVLPMREVVYDYVGIESGGENMAMNEGLPIDSTSLAAHLASSISASEGFMKVSNGLESADSTVVPIGPGSISSSS
ncbi:hypothetical protein EDC04DRAFT_3089340 [Pisolithus marmoratus]|nr:hypothetical protein EDC04DRAFT_3089340 [Pisolithus marmoratus]